MQSKLDENYNVTEPLQQKPKIKIINVSMEEIILEDDEIIDIIKKQNSIGESHIRIVKKITKRKSMDDKGKEVVSIIIEVEEATHSLILKKKKLNLGWRKCPVFNHFSIKRFFKWWGFYHIAKKLCA